MIGMDQVTNKIQQFTGYAKEKVGGVAGNRQQRAQGKHDQSKSNLKQAGAKLKNVFK